jgi:serine/threonine protein kinase
MGTVYEALDTRLGRLVALKRLHPHIAENPVASKRFLREGRAAARIRHPHVVQVLALGTEGGTPYLAMELLEGSDLASLLDARGPLSVREALDHVLPVIAAVCAAHNARVVHRDLKPSNVFVGRGPGGHPWPKVVDFGVSAILEGGESNQGNTAEGMVGTIAYLPPEQALGQSSGSFAGDQYALAVLLYECVTGERPFCGATAYEALHAVLNAAVVPPSRRAKNVSPEFDAAVQRAMSREPAERFPTLREFGAALLPMASDRSRWSWSPELLTSTFEAPPDSGRRKRSRLTSANAAVTATIDSARPPPTPSSNRNPSQGPTVQAYDGVAMVARGDTISILWKSPARAVRARWLFNEIDRVVATLPGGFLTLMIILPSSSPPDRNTAVESSVRLRNLKPAMRKSAVVVIGDSIWRALARGIVRVMMPKSGDRLYFTSDCDEAIAKLVKSGGSLTPSVTELQRDVRALYAALDPALANDG